MSAVWFYPSDNWPIGPTQRSGIYRGRMTTKMIELNSKRKQKDSCHLIEEFKIMHST